MQSVSQVGIVNHAVSTIRQVDTQRQAGGHAPLEQTLTHNSHHPDRRQPRTQQTRSQKLQKIDNNKTTVQNTVQVGAVRLQSGTHNRHAHTQACRQIRTQAAQQKRNKRSQKTQQKDSKRHRKRQGKTKMKYRTRTLQAGIKKDKSTAKRKH